MEYKYSTEAILVIPDGNPSPIIPDGANFPVITDGAPAEFRNLLFGFQLLAVRKKR
jgi:hypothetical protein